MSSTPTISAAGICYLVGAGPGDLGLVTLRARECIERAEVVVFDALCNPAMLAWAPAEAELIDAGKRAGAHKLKQSETNALLVEKTRAGKIVVRLKGGDPFVFGRGAEEALALARAGLAFEIVPGISSAIAGPAYAGIPVTQRGVVSQLTIFTGHEDPEKGGSAVDFAQLARTPGTRVMLMGVERLASITRQFLDGGERPDLPVALVRWATTGRQETLVGTLADIAEKAAARGFEAPAVAIFGEVVRAREELDWFEKKRRLAGKRIVVTRTRKQAGALSAKLTALGADVLEIPTIRIEKPANEREFAELVKDAHTYDWVMFTSPNGVDAFFGWFYRLYEDARDIGGARVAAVGPATAARVKEFRLKVDLQPSEAVAEALVGAFEKEQGSVENLKILLVRPETTREVLAAALTKKGAIVDEAIGYRTVPATAAEDRTGATERFRQEGADLVTFASSSAVENFLALGLPLAPELKFASLGPITSATMRARGLRVDVESSKANLDALVAAICRFYAGKK
ncbi:MAG: uroporphyrinogen-III C-methyltransferase [Verrucomicrobia bacterium]|nr:uroporphyrinogen-III C-methyltransferase [Verrucomicrobiota bacterium]